MMSMRRILLIWLLGGILASTLVAGLIAYVYALHNADDLFDRQLAHVAVNLPLNIQPQPEPPDNGDPYDDILIQIRDVNGKPVYPIRPSLLIPPLPRGYQTLEFNDVSWRVYTDEQSGRVVQVAQSEDVRRRLAAGLAFRATLPFLALLPLLAAIIWRAVDYSTASMLGIARAVERRSAEALDPLPVERIPGEMQPMVSALNDLLARLGEALTAQRSFIADAAHELRSPVTALKLQLQLIERARDPAQREAAFVKIRERVERIAHLVEQLLQLAREEPHGPTRAARPVALGPLLQGIVDDELPLAEANGVRLVCAESAADGADPVSAPVVAGQPESLRVLFGNLVDNAVRYCARGGRVEVRIGMHAGRPWVEVEDDGPGIPPGERERVFDRFHRLEGSNVIGSGLGLAIVRTIAERHAARVSLHDGAGGRGLLVRVEFGAGLAIC